MSGAAPLSSTQRLHSALGDIPTDEFEAALDADRQPTLLGLDSNGPRAPSNPGRFIAGPGWPPSHHRTGEAPTTAQTSAVLTSPPNLLPIAEANGGH